ncbi:MAG: ribosomal RNA small subunit methyltransferase A [Caldisericaceae bacterium]|nr:ribosomal RNA small subunit methyltransferase A [Caldisericaceae bacterium]RLD18546.1 MAG: ribosomal RNA small subunit methyltransferase A [Caldisericota bacterium]
MEISKQIRLLIKKYSLYPSKRLGQSFLIDRSAIFYIRDAINPVNDRIYLEIGPGFLFITNSVAERAKKIIAIEKDKRFEPYYEDTRPENIEIVIQDALKVDFSQWDVEELFGNIPFNISSPLIVKIAKTKTINRAVLLFQKEFAKRLLAGPGNKDYGSITIFTDFFFKKQFLKTFPPHFFYPMPLVSSTLINFVRRTDIQSVNEDLLFRIVKGAFSKRRKTLFNTLKKDFDGDILKNAIIDAGLPIEIRGENLSLEEFIRVSENLY